MFIYSTRIKCASKRLEGTLGKSSVCQQSVNHLRSGAQTQDGTLTVRQCVGPVMEGALPRSQVHWPEAAHQVVLWCVVLCGSFTRR